MHSLFYSICIFGLWVFRNVEGLSPPDPSMFKKPCADMVDPNLNLAWLSKQPLFHFQMSSLNIRYMGLMRLLGKDKVAGLSEAEASSTCVSLFAVDKETFVPGLSSEGKPKGREWIVKPNPKKPGAMTSTISGSPAFTSVIRYTDNESYIIKDICVTDGSRGFLVASVGNKDISADKMETIKKNIAEMGWSEGSYSIVSPNCKEIQKKLA